METPNVKANPMEALARKRSSAVARRRQIETEYQEKLKEADNEIQAIDNAMRVIRQAMEPYICKECEGSGEKRRPDAAGQMESVQCPACHGTGVAPEKEA